MIILDTNLVSEAMRPQPDPGVLNWLNQQPAESLYLTSITLAELLYGLAALPDSQRKNRLQQALDGLLQLFHAQILPLDAQAAQAYAGIASQARQQGHTLPLPDGYIAAIAQVHQAHVATRDTQPFEAAGLPVINPWSSQ